MKEERRFLVRGKEVHIGVDVHKESFHLTIRVGGVKVFHGGIPSQYIAGVTDEDFLPVLKVS